MWVFLWLFAVFWIAIAMSSKIWYKKNEMDIPYKIFNVVWVICLMYTFIKWWLFIVWVVSFWIAIAIKHKFKDKDEEFIYWPIKNKW